MEQLNPTSQPPESEPTGRVQYVPHYKWEDSLIQYRVLESMGYPVSVEVIPNTHPNVVRDSYADEQEEWEHTHYTEWAKLTSDASMNGRIELLSDPGDVFRSEYPEVATLLERHPVQIIHMIDDPPIGLDRLAHSLNEVGTDYRYGLQHENDEYPWEDLLQRAIVSAGDQYIYMLENGISEDPNPLFRPSASSLTTYLLLKAKGVQQLNGEQLAGLVEDYYRLVEKHFPEFAALKR